MEFLLSNFRSRMVIYLLGFFLLFLLGTVIAHFWMEVKWLILLVEFLFVSWLLLSNRRLLVIKWKMGVFCYLGFLLITFALWTRISFGTSTVDQLLSTFAFGANGILAVSWDLICSFLKWSVVLPTLLTVLTIQWVTNKLIAHIMPSLLIIIGFTAVGIQYNISTLLKIIYDDSRESQNDLFAENYKNPATETFHKSSSPKNLILIYVESLESNYQKKALFGRDLLTSLTTLQHSNISFSQFTQTSGTGWTIGGIVASQCGIPLKLISVFNGNRMGENIKEFLASATCLSDILKAQGYTNIFLKGASVDFAGFKSFLQSHQYDEMYGKQEWLNSGFKPRDMIGWGLPDDLLFQQAKLKLMHLMKTNQPFNLTILTIDTHGPEGQFNKTCYAHHARTFPDIVECSADEVASFIKYINDQGWMDKVVILVMGDHLAMPNTVLNRLTRSERYIFNTLISQVSLQKNREQIFHVDVLPTILHALGITWSDSKLALGYSGISTSIPAQTSTERFTALEKIATSPSSSYNNLWMSQQKRLPSI